MIKEKRNRIGKLPVVEELISHLLTAPQLSYLVKKICTCTKCFFVCLHVTKAK